MNPSNSYRRVDYPRNRLLMVDGGQLGRKKHMIHGLVEFDITAARESIRRQKREGGESVSFNAFFLSCLGKAIGQDLQVQAYRDWRGDFILFDEVDVNMLFEVDIDGKKGIRPHTIRAVNRKSAIEISSEISTFQREYQASREASFIDNFVLLPGWIRRLFLRLLFCNPIWVKELSGTVMVSSLGMFGTGGGWGIPVPNHSLQLTLGGISKKPVFVGGQIEAHQFLSVTVSFDHDVIDGAPAARFVSRLQKMIERGFNPDCETKQKDPSIVMI